MTTALRAPADVSHAWCEHCGDLNTQLKHEVEQDGELYAVVFTACHRHEGRHEVTSEVVMGEFGSDDPSDRVVFGCRVGPIDGLRDPAAGLVDAAWLEDGAVYGRALTRPEALEHPWIISFWDVVDLVLAEEPIVRRHLYAPH